MGELIVFRWSSEQPVRLSIGEGGNRECRGLEVARRGRRPEAERARSYRIKSRSDT